VTDDDDLDRVHDADVDIVDLDWVAGDGSHGGWVRLDVRRRLGAARFLAVVSMTGHDPVVVIDHELPAPTNRFELRAPGVWTELCCETPLDHWTVGLEAFGLVVPASEVVSPASRGERVPLGLDLDLDTVAAPEATPGGFTIRVRVHGEVLSADGSLEVDGVGVRRRRWDGSRPGPTAVASAAGVPGRVAVAWPAEDGPGSVERRGWHTGPRPGWCTLAADAGQARV
jgi:hypothetical protein